MAKKRWCVFSKKKNFIRLPCSYTARANSNSPFTSIIRAGSPAVLLTVRKQVPFCETIKIKFSVKSPKVVACSLITSEMTAVSLFFPSFFQSSDSKRNQRLYSRPGSPADIHILPCRGTTKVLENDFSLFLFLVVYISSQYRKAQTVSLTLTGKF